MPTCCIKNCRNPASDAFSNNVVFYIFPRDAVLRRKWLEAYGKDVFKLINDWFDVHNSQYKFGKHAGSHAYGVDLDKQNKTLDLMTELITKMRVISKTYMMPFQKGILLSNISLK